MLDLQLCAYRPDLFGLERWLGAEQFGLIPRDLGRAVTCKFIEGLHGRTPLLRWSASVCLGGLDLRVRSALGLTRALRRVAAR